MRLQRANQGKRCPNTAHYGIGPIKVRRPWAIGGIVALAGALVIGTTSLFSQAEIDTTAPGSATEAGFYPLGEPATGLSIGERPPLLAADDDEPVRDSDGRVVDLATLAGRPLWVVFWASWCPPCQQETPDLQRAWEASAERGLEIVAIDVQETADIVSAYAATYGLSYGMAVDPSGSALGTGRCSGSRPTTS